MLFVEHDMDIVERHADRVIAFYSGRIIADDTPAAALATDDVRRYVTGELLAGLSAMLQVDGAARRDRIGAWRCAACRCRSPTARWSAWSAATAPARRP